jgi:hypothetical protein
MHAQTQVRRWGRQRVPVPAPVSATVLMQRPAKVAARQGCALGHAPQQVLVAGLRVQHVHVLAQVVGAGCAREPPALLWQSCEARQAAKRPWKR